MRAYRIPKFQSPPEWQEVPQPVAGSGQVVVKVAAVGLCHSDLGVQTIPGSFVENWGWKTPFTLGHEIAGHVYEVGDGVEDLVIGEAVALASPSCGRCWYCVRGESNNCTQSAVGRGYGDDGGLADYMLVRNPRDILNSATLMLPRLHHSPTRERRHSTL